MKGWIKWWLGIDAATQQLRLTEDRLVYLQREAERIGPLTEDLGRAHALIDNLQRTLAKMERDYRDLVDATDSVSRLKSISDRARYDLAAAEAAGFDSVEKWRAFKAQRRAEAVKSADVYDPARNRLSPLPDGMGYHWCNLPPPDFRQINVRDEGGGVGINHEPTWVAYVAGEEVSSGHSSKEEAFAAALQWASENREVADA